MFVALGKSHKTLSVSACYLKNGDAITFPPHTIRLTVFKFLKHWDLHAPGITENTKTADVNTTGFVAQAGPLTKEMEISIEVLLQNHLSTTPELFAQPLSSSEFDGRYTPKIKWWLIEGAKPDNTWQKVSVGPTVLGLSSTLPPCLPCDGDEGWFDTSQYTGTSNGNKYSHLVGSFYHPVI